MFAKLCRKALQWDASGLMGRLLDATLHNAAALRWKLMVWKPLSGLFQPEPQARTHKQRTILCCEQLPERLCPTTVSLTSSGYSVAETAGSVAVTAVLNTA